VLDAKFTGVKGIPRFSMSGPGGLRTEGETKICFFRAVVSDEFEVDLVRVESPNPLPKHRPVL